METAGFFINDPHADWANRLITTLELHRDTRRADGIDYPEVRIEAVWKDMITDAQTDGILSGEGNIPMAIVDYETRVNPCWPMPGLDDTLCWLKQNGFHLGIVSNAQFYTPLLFPALSENTLDAHGFDTDLCIWSYQERIGKPSQEL